MDARGHYEHFELLELNQRRMIESICSCMKTVAEIWLQSADLWKITRAVNIRLTVSIIESIF